MAIAPMPPMEPQVTHPKLPMILAIGITAIIFGLGGYVIASMANTDSEDLSTTTGKSTATTTSSASPTTKATATTTSSTDETKDWKTYSNTQYNFSFKYPSDWKTYTTGSTTYNVSPNNASDRMWYIQTSTSTVQKEVDGLKGDFQGATDVKGDITATDVSKFGTTAKKVTVTYKSGMTASWYVFSKGSTTYVVAGEVSNASEENAANYAIANKILETLTFTN